MKPNILILSLIVFPTLAAWGSNHCKKDQELLTSLGLPQVVDCEQSQKVPYRVLKESVKNCAKNPLTQLTLENGEKTPLHNPTCLIAVRGESLNKNVQASYKNAWSNIPKNERRELWKACATPNTAWDKLAQCLEEEAPNFADPEYRETAGKQFGFWKDNLSAVLANGAMELRSGLLLCSPEVNEALKSQKLSKKTKESILSERKKLVGLGENGQRVDVGDCTQEGEDLKKNRAAIARGIQDLIMSNLKGNFSCEGDYCPFDNFAYVPGGGTEQEFHACELGLGQKLYDEMSCIAEFNTVLPRIEGLELVNFLEKDDDVIKGRPSGSTDTIHKNQALAAAREAYFDFLRLEYAKNVQRSAWATLGEGLELPSSCGRFEKDLKEENASANQIFDHLNDSFKKAKDGSDTGVPTMLSVMATQNPDSLIEQIDKKVAWLNRIQKTLQVKTGSMKSNFTQKVEDENGIVYELANDKEAIEFYQQRIGEILRFAPFLIGKAGVGTAIRGGMLRSPTSLEGVKKWKKAKDKKEALKKLLSDYKKLGQEQLARACERSEDKGLSWKDLVKHSRLVEAATANLKNEKLKEGLTQFHQCIVDNMDRYASKTGLVVTLTLPIPVMGLLASGTGVVLVAGLGSAVSAGLNSVVVYDDLQHSWGAYKAAQEGFAGTQGESVPLEEVKEASDQMGTAMAGSVLGVAGGALDGAAFLKSLKVIGGMVSNAANPVTKLRVVADAKGNPVKEKALVSFLEKSHANGANLNIEFMNDLNEIHVTGFARETGLDPAKGRLMAKFLKKYPKVKREDLLALAEKDVGVLGLKRVRTSGAIDTAVTNLGKSPDYAELNGLGLTRFELEDRIIFADETRRIDVPRARGLDGKLHFDADEAWKLRKALEDGGDYKYPTLAHRLHHRGSTLRQADELLDQVVIGLNDDMAQEALRMLDYVQDQTTTRNGIAFVGPRGNVIELPDPNHVSLAHDSHARKEIHEAIIHGNDYRHPRANEIHSAEMQGLIRGPYTKSFYEGMGYSVSTRPGVVVMTKGESVIELPTHQAGTMLAPTERRKLMKAVRDGQKYTFPDVAASEAREVVKHMDQIMASPYQSSHYKDLGYDEIVTPDHIVLVKGKSKIKLPSAKSPMGPAEKRKLAEAIREGKDYTHPDLVAR